MTGHTTTFRRQIDFAFPFDLVVTLGDAAEIVDVAILPSPKLRSARFEQEAARQLPGLLTSLRAAEADGYLVRDVSWTCESAVSADIIMTIREAQEYVLSERSPLNRLFQGAA